MNAFYRKQTQKNIKLMQAFLGGKILEWRYRHEKTWRYVDNPSWNFEMLEYRLAPKNKYIRD